jgi:hypothetical protein
MAAVLAPLLEAAYGMERAGVLVREIDRLASAPRWVPDFRTGVRHCAWCKQETAAKNRYTFSLRAPPGGVHYACRACVDSWQSRVDGARWGQPPPEGEMLVAEVARAVTEAPPPVVEALHRLEAAVRVPADPLCALCQQSREGDPASRVLPPTVAVCARCVAMGAYYFSHRLRDT